MKLEFIKAGIKGNLRFLHLEILVYCSLFHREKDLSKVDFSWLVFVTDFTADIIESARLPKLVFVTIYSILLSRLAAHN